MNNDRNKNKKKRPRPIASSTSRRGRGWWGLHIFKSKEKEEERRLWPHSATRLTPPTLPPPSLHHTHSYTPLVVRLRVKGSAAGLLDIG